MSRRSPFPSSPHSPNLSTATHSSTTTTSTSATPHLPPSASCPMSEEEDNIPPPTSTSPLPPHTATSTSTALSLLPSPTSARTPLPIREDCWSEEATRTLVEAWGSHYIELNRGNLRQKQWQDVADAVNAVHAHTKKLRRTDIQCKNRIDTLKKKFKVEKTKFNESNGHYVSPWPFFPAIDSLLGDSFLKANPPRSKTRKRFASSVPASEPSLVRKEFLALPPPPSFVPVGPRSKRPAHGMVHSEDSRYQQKFQDMVGSGEDDDDYDDEEADTFFNGGSNGNKRRKRRRREEEYEAGVTVEEGYGQLAEALERLGDIYERVEEAKQRQMVELEKQRMQFAKDLEIQRMKLFMESQLQLQKLKLSKSKSQADRYS